MGNGTASATYSYLANSPLVQQIAFANSGAQRMVTTKQYDFLNRLTSISSVPSGAAAVSFAYDYNSANQRTLRREADGSYWRYEFDSLGQVKSGKKFWADGTPVAGQQFEYAFDTIGNRTSAKAGGARVIYLHLPEYDTIVLFYLYTKAHRENLSPEQLRRLRDAAAIIKREFRA